MAWGASPPGNSIHQEAFFCTESQTQTVTCYDGILGGGASQELNCEHCQDYDIMIMDMHRKEIED